MRVLAAKETTQFLEGTEALESHKWHSTPSWIMHADNLLHIIWNVYGIHTIGNDCR